MNNAEYDREVAKLVEAAVQDAFGSVLGAAKATAIPYTTLDRKIRGGAPFNVSELRRIAAATGRKTKSFLPDDRAFDKAVA